MSDWHSTYSSSYRDTNYRRTARLVFFFVINETSESVWIADSHVFSPPPVLCVCAALHTQQTLIL